MTHHSIWRTTAAFAIAIAVRSSCRVRGRRSRRRHGEAGRDDRNEELTEQYVLRPAVQQALEAKGYKVEPQAGHRQLRADRHGLQERQGQLLCRVHGRAGRDIAKQPLPSSAAATWAAAKAFESSKRHATLLQMTPFSDTDSFGMLTTTAKKLA